MKKVLILPLFAVIAFVSQAWGAYASCAADLGNTFYCDWGTGCYELNKGANDTDNCTTVYNNCKRDGFLYTGVTSTGDNKACGSNGGTWIGEGNDPNFNNGVKIWCKWATSCQPLKNQGELDNCIEDGFVFSGVPTTGVGSGKACEGGTWTGQGKNPNVAVLGCCKWDTGDKCWPILDVVEGGKTGAERVDNCKSGSNKFWNGVCPAPGDGTCPTTPPVNANSSSGGSTPSSSSGGGSSTSGGGSSTSGGGSSTSGGGSSTSGGGSSTSDGGTSSGSGGGDTPIISYNSTPAVGLNVTHFARNLQIASGRDASVFLFDIRGKQMFSQKVLSGTTTISLAGQKQGVYYAVVKAGSQKQTLKIILK